jgi:acyl-CoA reductase-like NAD-dependent aldehyde dehydrogenase
VEVLGAIQSPATLERLERAAGTGEVILASRAITHPQFAGATVRTPVVVAVDAGTTDVYETECFGPVVYLVKTRSTADSLAEVDRTVTRHGAITLAVYSDNSATLEAARDLAERVGVCLSENLTGGLFVNQSAAFSDFHATGANPAANAALCDQAFVANRFRVVENRRMLPAPADAAE